MGKRSLRAAQREKTRRRKKIYKIMGIGAALAFIGFFAWLGLRPSIGESVPIMEDAGAHVEEGTDPGPFNSDPPTSGKHYGHEFEAGFYDEASPQAQYPYPEGYIGHNLEHGYVIFWYNCNLLDETGCETLKTEIQDVMDEFDNYKLIAFPRSTIDVPLVMTSWGQLLRFETFDEKLASQFVKVNRNRAPEPNAE